MPPIPTSLPDDGWGVLTVLIIVGGYVLTTMANKGKKKQGERSQNMEEFVRVGVNLGPTVAMLSEEVQTLKKQIAELLPVKQVKYPAALNTVCAFQEAHPDSPVEVAPEIIEDLNQLQV